MKKIITLSVLTCLLGLNVARAQKSSEAEKPVFTNEIHTGIFQILVGELYLHYEKQINYDGWLAYGLVTDSHKSNSDLTGWFGGVQYRRYAKKPSEINDYNAYAGVLAGYGIKEKADLLNSSSVNYYRAGIIVGVKVILYDYVSLDFNWAHVYQNPKVESSTNESNFNSGQFGLAYRGFRPQINCTVGIRF